MNGSRCVAAMACTLGVIAANSHPAAAQSSDQIQELGLTAELGDASMRGMAIGLSSLASLRISSFDIDIAWKRAGEQDLTEIKSGAVDFGLVNLDMTDISSLEGVEELTAVMKYWPEDGAADEQGDGPYLLVANSSVDPGLIGDLIEAAMADEIVLKTAGVDPERLAPETSMVDLPISRHQGVDAWLQTSDIELPEDDTAPAPTDVAAVDEGVVEDDESPSPSVTVSSPASDSSTVEAASPVAAATPAEPLPPAEVVSPAAAPSSTVTPAPEPSPQSTPAPALTEAAEDGRSFTVYFDTNESELDRDDFKSVAAACQFAATLPNARFVISGHTDTVGPQPYNDKLSDQRANTVASAIRNDPRFSEALNVVDFGETKPAINTGDEVPEPKNRRVEITVFPK